MWYKNIKFFQLANFGLNAETLEDKLASFRFTPCSPGMPQSVGWSSVIEQPMAPLVHAALGKMMIALKVEEKVLPSTVVREHTQQKIQELEQLEDRKISKREKASIKDQTYFSLIQKAFCRSYKIFAYVDTQENWLVVNCTNSKKLELFVTHLKKALEGIELITPETKNIPKVMTQWLLSNHYPSTFAIESSAVLEDFKDTKRTIRVKNQDLFNDSIQNLIKDGCVPKQISLTWHDRITFNLNHDLSLTSLKYDDEIIAEAKQDAAETEAERFDADFLIMTETLKQLREQLFEVVMEQEPKAVCEPEPDLMPA